MVKATVVIPARGGSKRIPGKNKRLFNGLPMVEWPIRSSLDAPSVADVVISTDDDEIAKISEVAGADEVVMRPGNLASDTAATAPVIRHAIDSLELDNEAMVMCLYPTAAVTVSQIEQAAELAIRWPDMFVVSVGSHVSPLQRALKLDDDGTMSPLYAEFIDARTQDLPNHFFDAGKIYIASAALWRSIPNMLSAPFVPLFLPRWASVDIDNPEDWEVAEALHRVFALGEQQ